MATKNRITTTAWSYLKSNYSEEIEKMAMIEVSVNRFNIGLKRYRKRKSLKPRPKKKKNNIQRHGPELGNILDWLEDNCSDQYYPTFIDEKLEDRHKTEKIVQVYFMEETDAMAFKLVYE